jgi:hypothetical protein
MREEQYAVGEAHLEHQRLSSELAAAKAEPVDAALLAAFQSHLESLNKVLEEIAAEGHPYGPITFDAFR